MYTPPPDLSAGDVAAALRDGWGLSATALSYLPVGYGGHHWSAVAGGRRWFVTADDLDAKPWLGESRDAAFAGLAAAYDAAARLRESGLAFVVAPLRTPSGVGAVRAGERYAVSVTPWVDGTAGGFGDDVTPEQRDARLRLLAELHAATFAVRGLAVSPPALPDRPVVDRALAELGTPWSGGPFAEEARLLLAEHADGVRLLLADFDGRAAAVRPADLVVTHGEPHPGNVLTTPDGPRLVDWDTVALAPPERDLWLLGDGDFAAYGGPVDPERIALYRLRWRLADIASFTAALRSPRGTADDLRLLRANL
ncbi:MAG TPA: phosphotransferase [Frankiaceae bacterium]|nr:phosphotransferase [Frankiaceae bacterium]